MSLRRRGSRVSRAGEVERTEETKGGGRRLEGGKVFFFSLRGVV